MGRTSDAKERLIDSALRLMEARSYADVGVQELCNHAGVKKGSFYYFFPSKRDLTLAALDQQWQVTAATLRERVFNQERPPLERIQRFFATAYECQIEFKEQQGHTLGCCFGNLAVEMSTQDEVIRAKIEDIFNRYVDFIETALIEAVQAEELPPLETRTAAASILAYMQGLILLSKTQNNPSLIRDLGRFALRLCMPQEGQSASSPLCVSA